MFDMSVCAEFGRNGPNGRMSPCSGDSKVSWNSFMYSSVLLPRVMCALGVDSKFSCTTKLLLRDRIQVCGSMLQCWHVGCTCSPTCLVTTKGLIRGTYVLSVLVDIHSVHELRTVQRIKVYVITDVKFNINQGTYVLY